MKLALAILAALAAAAAADVEITREEVASLPSIDLQKLAAKATDYEGRIVRLKFNYRSDVFQKKPDGGLSGMISIYQSDLYVTRSRKYGHAEVTVPQDGVAWFMKQPTTESRATLTVIARIKKTRKDHYPEAELLGREIKTDTKGPRIIW